MKLRLGQSDAGPVELNLEQLIETRLLITATSGGGKSGAVFQLCEQAVAHVQIIVIDPEGEYAPLRAKHPFVLAGPDGETPATVPTAGLLAHRLLELGVSAILDIYELPHTQRHEFVRDFLDAMVDAPKNLWHPVLVIIDEAHIFCLSDDTEILTDAGWKSYRDIVVGETLPCYDVSLQQMIPGKVLHAMVREFDGEMVSAVSDGVDALMTPDHRMVIERLQRGAGRYQIYPPSICCAGSIAGNFAIPVPRFQQSGQAEITLEDCRVLGWLITDGYYSGRKSGIRYLNIEQSVATTKNGHSTSVQMREVLEPRGASVYAKAPRSATTINSTYNDLPVSKQVIKNGSQTLYFGAYLTRHFSSLLTSGLHRIPRWLLLQGSEEQLSEVLRGLVEGDGTNAGNSKWGWRGWMCIYCGHNDLLADDVLELCTRLGVSAVKKVTPQTKQLCVHLSARKRHWIRKSAHVPYSGKVWDVTVTTGAFIARRNGKPFVTGNCPEKGSGDSVAANAVMNMATRGRKRGFCIVPATQRLAMLSKTVAANCQNSMVGRTSQIDQTRAAETLHINGKPAREEFWRKINRMKTGEFFAYGMAFNAVEPTDFQVDRAETLPEKKDRMALSPPPAPAAIRELLPQLASLPQEAEKRAQTLESLESELAAARQRIRQLENAAPGSSEEDRETIRMLTEKLEEVGRQFDAVVEMAKSEDERRGRAMELLDQLRGLLSPSETQATIAAAAQSVDEVRRNAGTAVAELSLPSARVLPPATATSDMVNDPQQRILNAMATLHSMRNANVTIEWIACTAGTTARARGFEENLRQLKNKGLVDGIRLTPAGEQIASASSTPATFRDVMARLAVMLSEPQRTILHVLKGSPHTPAQLADAIGTTERARGFEENVRQLRKRELIESAGGKLRLTGWLDSLR